MSQVNDLGKKCGRPYEVILVNKIYCSHCVIRIIHMYVVYPSSNEANCCNTTNEGVVVTTPSDFQNEPPYDAHFGTNG